MAAKILLLDEVDRGNRIEAVDDLLAFYTSPGLDHTLHGVVGDTLRSLLARNEGETVKRLDSADASIRKVCLQVAAMKRYPSAGDPLSKLAETETSPADLLEILSAIDEIDPGGALDLFRRHAAHDDPFVSALCIEALGKRKDASAGPFLQGLVDAAEAEDKYQTCAVSTEKAISALSAVGGEDALPFLIRKIHHRNPTARRFIHKEIVAAGTKAIPHLAKVFEGDDADAKILGANLLGTIGDRGAANILVSALDHGLEDHPNIRFAIYEALGQIPSLKSVVCLFDAVTETDEMTLLAVAAALDHQLNPGIVEKILTTLKADEATRVRFLRAIVSGRALNLFECLYGDPDLSAPMMAAVQSCRDGETLSVFRGKLLDLRSAAAKEDAAKLVGTAPEDGAKRLLAVDDSKSMLLFYRGVASVAEMEVVTAGNGKEAIDLLEQGGMFDLIITDLNMPVMDGIEFTRRARACFFSESTPILMATTESEGSQRALAQDAGVTGFLQKPLQAESLARTIRQHVSAQ